MLWSVGLASLQPTLRWPPIVSSCRRKWPSPPWDTRWLGWAPEASWSIVKIITFPGSLCLCISRTMSSSCSLTGCCYLPACHLTSPHLPGANCGFSYSVPVTQLRLTSWRYKPSRLLRLHLWAFASGFSVPDCEHHKGRRHCVLFNHRSLSSAEHRRWLTQ